jgi:hypothetical protein
MRPVFLGVMRVNASVFAKEFFITFFGRSVDLEFPNGIAKRFPTTWVGFVMFATWLMENEAASSLPR